MFILEYCQILIFIVLSIGLASLLLFLGLKISPNVVDFEKLSAYECGFLPIGDARQSFHVRFYLVGILFLLFDLEVVFLFPYSVLAQTTIQFTNVLILIIIFLFLLVLGLIYEWTKGVLDWE